MTVDLSKFVGRPVLVTYQDTSWGQETVTQNERARLLDVYCLGHHIYIRDGSYISRTSDNDSRDIVHIKEIEEQVMVSLKEIDCLKAQPTFKDQVWEVVRDACLKSIYQGENFCINDNASDEIAQIVMSAMPAKYAEETNMFEKGYNRAIREIEGRLGV